MTLFDAIKARADAATPGPWLARRFSVECHCGATYQAQAVEDCSEEWCEEVRQQDRPRIANLYGLESFARADAEFIAAARTDVPLLLRALELACARLATVRLPVAYADYWLELAAREQQRNCEEANETPD